MKRTVKGLVYDNIREESEAIKGYGKAAKKADKEKNPKAAKLFRHIQKDEREHRRELKSMKIIPARKK